MKDNETRLAATGVIWTAFTIVMVTALILSNRFETGFMFVMALMFTIAALLSTQYIWKPNRDASVQLEHSEKAKHRSRVERMLDNMDERELDELRARLTGDRDGEATSLEDLLVQHERQQR